LNNSIYKLNDKFFLIMILILIMNTMGNSIYLALGINENKNELFQRGIIKFSAFSG